MGGRSNFHHETVRDSTDHGRQCDPARNSRGDLKPRLARFGQIGRVGQNQMDGLRFAMNLGTNKLGGRN